MAGSWVVSCALVVATSAQRAGVGRPGTAGDFAGDFAAPHKRSIGMENPAVKGFLLHRSRARGIVANPR